MSTTRAKIDPNLIEEFNITNIQPVKKKNGGINGVGNVSCFGFIGKQKVKIYTPYRDDMPELREKLERVRFNCPVRFPPLIGTRGKFIIEQWIDGPNLTQISLNSVKGLVPSMVDFLFEFKEVKLDYDSSYNHLKCFRDTVAKRGDNNFLIEKWDEEFAKHENIPKHLRHGDLHEANIVLNNGQMYVVDNDGISFDNGWFTAWRKSFLYSTKFPRYPIADWYHNWEEIEQKYYGDISFRFMELTQFLRQAFFQRDFIDFTNTKLTKKQLRARL